MIRLSSMQPSPRPFFRSNRCGDFRVCHCHIICTVYIVKKNQFNSNIVSIQSNTVVECKIDFFFLKSSQLNLKNSPCLLKTDQHKRSQFTFLFSIKWKFQKMFYSFTCILPGYVAHEITKEFWKNSHLKNITASFLLRCQKTLWWNTPETMISFSFSPLLPL